MGSTFIDSSSSILVCSSCDRMPSTPRSLSRFLIAACWSSSCLMKAELDAELLYPRERERRQGGGWPLRHALRTVGRDVEALTSQLGCAHCAGSVAQAQTGTGS